MPTWWQAPKRNGTFIVLPRNDDLATAVTKTNASILSVALCVKWKRKAQQKKKRQKKKEWTYDYKLMARFVMTNILNKEHEKTPSIIINYTSPLVFVIDENIVDLCKLARYQWSTIPFTYYN